MMETLNKIKELVEKMSIDTDKVVRKGNRSASVRARKNAQQVKLLVSTYRKEILNKLKEHGTNP